jgi:hypothetical protein
MLKLDNIENIKTFFKDRKKSFLNKSLKSLRKYSLLIGFSSLLAGLCAYVAHHYIHIPYYLNVICISLAILFSVTSMVILIEALDKLDDVMSALFNRCSEYNFRIFEAKYELNNYQNLPNFLNLLTTLSLTINESWLTVNEINEFEKRFIYNQAILEKTTFENAPNDIQEKLKANENYLDNIIRKCLKKIDRKKIYNSHDFKHILNDSLTVKMLDLNEEHEKLIIEKERQNKTSEELEKHFLDKLSSLGKHSLLSQKIKHDKTLSL